MSEITHERLTELLRYNPKLGNFVWIKKSAPQSHAKVGSIAGDSSSSRYPTISVDGKKYKTHSLAWFYTHKRWPTMIDHINGNKCDNRIENLREADHSMNSQNVVKRYSNNTSGFMGVGRHKTGYIARITIGRESKHLGVFKTAQEAHQAYLSEKRKSHKGCTI